MQCSNTINNELYGVKGCNFRTKNRQWAVWKIISLFNIKTRLIYVNLIYSRQQFENVYLYTPTHDMLNVQMSVKSGLFDVKMYEVFTFII